MKGKWAWISTAAGCYDCPATWNARNGQACAARHHASTGHQTYSRTTTETVYGEQVADGRQGDLFQEVPSGRNEGE